MVCMFFFFFSSRRRHTRCLSDWSSDVCSSDLIELRCRLQVRAEGDIALVSSLAGNKGYAAGFQRRKSRKAYSVRRSEERRVGKECRSRWWPYHEKKKEKESRTIQQRRTQPNGQ